MRLIASINGWHLQFLWIKLNYLEAHVRDSDLLLPFVMLFTKKASWEEMFLRVPSGFEWTISISVTESARGHNAHVGETSAGVRNSEDVRDRDPSSWWQRQVVFRAEDIYHYWHRTHSALGTSHTGTLSFETFKKMKFIQVEKSF